MEEIKARKSRFRFCRSHGMPWTDAYFGGGQPIKSAKTRSTIDVFKKRSSSLYTIDEKSVLRKSHENPYVKTAYKEFFEKPGSHTAHELLHTSYAPREKYNIK